MDSVEKSITVRRRHSKRHIKPLLLHALEACVALTLLLSLYSTPLSLAVDSAVDGYRRFAGVLTKPFPVFLLSNAIIVVIACLSRNNINKKKQAAAVSEFSDNLYGEYLSRRRDHSPVTLKPEPKVEAEKAVVAVRVDEKKAPCYRRTKSALAGGRPREAALRRSATEIGRETVDDLSNEEFKRTVESYIARTKWLLHKEITADITESETASVTDRMVVVKA